MNMSDLVVAVVGTTGLPRNDAKHLVDSVLGAICDAAARGETIALTGFGTFTPKHAPARKGFHPRTGDPIVIPVSSRLAFKSAKALKERLSPRH